jgi:hypothetical protein
MSVVLGFILLATVLLTLDLLTAPKPAPTPRADLKDGRRAA